MSHPVFLRIHTAISVFHAVNFPVRMCFVRIHMWHAVCLRSCELFDTHNIRKTPSSRQSACQTTRRVTHSLAYTKCESVPVWCVCVATKIIFKISSSFGVFFSIGRNERRACGMRCVRMKR